MLYTHVRRRTNKYHGTGVNEYFVDEQKQVREHKIYLQQGLQIELRNFAQTWNTTSYEKRERSDPLTSNGVTSGEVQVLTGSRAGMGDQLSAEARSGSLPVLPCIPFMPRISWRRLLFKRGFTRDWM